MISLDDCVRVLDTQLSTHEIPDYDRALNGLQLQNAGIVTRVGVAVDFSAVTVRQAIEIGVDLLVVHHGMFWGGAAPIIGRRYERLQMAIAHNLAVYASHLPLDLHPTMGNNTLLARQLGLVPETGFGQFRSVNVGVTGESDLATSEIVNRIRAFAEPLGAHVVTTPYDIGRRTKAWAIVTGAGASTDTLSEAVDRGIDTFIVGEGPHHTAVDARDQGVVIIYAGHYATETLGVQALGAELGRVFSLPWSFLHAPTGL